MIRYCDDCRQRTWPKTDIMGNFKCQVCGKITWCHIPSNPPAEKTIEAARAKYLEEHEAIEENTEVEAEVAPPEPEEIPEPKKDPEKLMRADREKRLIRKR